jgi:hypothetical protein
VGLLLFFRILLALFVSFNIVISDGNFTEAHASGYGVCSSDFYDVKPRMGHDEVARRVKALIRCVTDRWSVPGGASKALDVAECESGFWPWAKGGDNLGVFQHKDNYWRDRVHSFLKKRWFTDQQWERINRDATIYPGAAYLTRANVIIAIRMAHNGGWEPWSCA